MYLFFGTRGSFYFCMPKNNYIEPSPNNSRGTFTSSSGNELIPIINKKNQLLVDARLLHQLLQVLTPFHKWIDRRIADFKLEENLDFWTSLSTKLKKDYAFSIRIAEMIAMFEQNEIGKQIRMQLMKQESSFIFNDPKKLKGLATYEHNGQKMYRYADVLNELGYRKGGSNYKNAEKYPNDFANVGGTILVSEQYAIVMSHRRIARNLLAEIKIRQLELPFNEKEVSHE